MLSVNYIYNFLNKKQCKIDDSYYKNLKFFESSKIIKTEHDEDNCINDSDYDTVYDTVKDINSSNKTFNEETTENKFFIPLKDSFNIIFNKSISDFYYDNKIYKNKSYIFTLINSVLSISNELLLLYDFNERQNIIKEFIKKIDNDLFGIDLYKKFDYAKDRSFNKADIQEVIKLGFQFKHTDKFNLLKKYISDYLGINLYIISVENDLINYSKCEYYLPNYFGDEINKFLPSVIIILENEIHKPVMYKNTSNSSIIKYSEYKDVIDNLWIHLKIKKGKKSYRNQTR